MKILKSLILVFLIALFLMFNSCCTGIKEAKDGNFFIGWASVDITPENPVLLHNGRISEGVSDPITVTALAIESGTGLSSEKVIMISCDLISISDGSRYGMSLYGSDNNLLGNVRGLLKESLPELDPGQIILNATHTHSGPYYSTDRNSEERFGIELDVMPPYKVLDFLSELIAKAAEQAWNGRKIGGISYGLGHAVVGHNRLLVDLSGNSRRYGNTNSPEFSHVEGYEDHSVNLLYTWDNKSRLTGVVVNTSSPPQVSEQEFFISADYWHDTRIELSQRLGKDIYILPQNGAAGDQSPHIMVETKAEARMQQLIFPDAIEDRGSIRRRKQIAMRIADAVTSVLPYMHDQIEWDPMVAHKMKVLGLSRQLIGIEDISDALKESQEWKKQYDQLLYEIKENPEIKDEPRWYVNLISSYSRMLRFQRVQERYELEKIQPELPVEIHVIRIGDIVIATNPFELYLDYGVRIKARSPAVQTFVVQLSNGSSAYLPTSRSIAGGDQSVRPALILIGPEGGQELVEKTLELINLVWQTNE